MNPYEILYVDRHASKKDIISAAALAMRTRKFSGQQIARAQKELLDPIAKAVHEFIWFLDKAQVEPLLSRSIAASVQAVPQRLAIFDKRA